MRNYFILALALIFNTILLNAEDLIHNEFPNNNQDDVSIQTFLRFSTDYKIDTSSFISISPLVFPDTTSDTETPNLYLIETDFYDNLPDTLRQLVSHPCSATFTDTNKISIKVLLELEYDTDYTVIFNDNLKFLKPDSTLPSGYDTVSSPQTFYSLFKTIKAPYHVVNTSFDSTNQIHCDDTIKVYFNRKLDFSLDIVDNMFLLRKFGTEIAIDSLSHKYELDTLQTYISFGDDSTYVEIIPNQSLSEGSSYLLNVDMYSIHGNI